ncbi:MAG TPA: DoxX family protein [Solirubrobacteraceae bacterium]|jgi:putative oxidoreductase|nr:DoxX family protein [Solirubrobacteraceae bacterium]
MKLGLTLLRMIVGALFFGHGTQKLFGWFGGHGIEGTAGFFETIGLKPGRKHATAAGAAEAGGGVLVALGFLTPAAAASLIGVMSTAIRKVHGKNGPWVTEGGYEYNLALIAIMVALADVGPGDVSLDHALGIEVKGPLVALLALAAGIGGGLALTAGSQDTEPAPPPTDTPEPSEATAAV